MCGAPVVIQQRFDPVQFCANVEKYKIGISLVVPPVLVLLSRHPGKSINDIPGCVTHLYHTSR
jgi:4-coumarate--CoA ligase